MNSKKETFFLVSFGVVWDFRSYKTPGFASPRKGSYYRALINSIFFMIIETYLTVHAPPGLVPRTSIPRRAATENSV